MAEFVKGDIVVVPFPFSDLSSSKKRPAMVLSCLNGDDLILIQITSKTSKDPYAILLEESDFASGSLHQPSHVRPNRLFTADRKIILYTAGKLKSDKLNEVVNRVVEIVRS